MKWVKNRNIGGGYMIEFINCIEGMYTIAKFNRLAKTEKERKCNDNAIGEYFKKLDEFELPFTVQNDILMVAYNDKTPGFPTFQIHAILNKYVLDHTK